jgi:6-phosphogluconolactonase/glucosamine-6-phosphate isomerase/deaminase
MALTVGVATVLEAREVVVIVTGLRKSLALSKAIGKSRTFNWRQGLVCEIVERQNLVVMDVCVMLTSPVILSRRGGSKPFGR